MTEVKYRKNFFMNNKGAKKCWMRRFHNRCISSHFQLIFIRVQNLIKTLWKFLYVCLQSRSRLSRLVLCIFTRIHFLLINSSCLGENLATTTNPWLCHILISWWNYWIKFQCNIFSDYLSILGCLFTHSDMSS